jgi:hypothetical protein
VHRRRRPQAGRSPSRRGRASDPSGPVMGGLAAGLDRRAGYL